MQNNQNISSNYSKNKNILFGKMLNWFGEIKKLFKVYKNTHEYNKITALNMLGALLKEILSFTLNFLKVKHKKTKIFQMNK